MGEYGSMFLLFQMTAFATFFLLRTFFLADPYTLRVQVLKVLFWVS